MLKVTTMKKNTGVYIITNKVNGHKYIGSAVDIRQRWRGHISDLNKNKHHSVYLQRAWNKYGSQSFEFSVIEYCEKDQLIEREQFYLDTEKPVYNISPTAGSVLGIKYSPEAIAKNSAAKKGNDFACRYMRSPEARAKFSAIHKGKKLSVETRAKISATKRGRKASAETRTKMSAAHRGEKGSSSKLTWEQVGEIRSRYAEGNVTQRKLANEYGVNQKVIWSILNHKIWKVD